MEQAEEKRCVAPWTNCDPPVCMLRSRTIARVNDDQLAPRGLSVQHELERRHARLSWIMAPDNDHLSVVQIGPLIGVLTEQASIAKHGVQSHVNGHVHPAIQVACL